MKKLLTVCAACMVAGLVSAQVVSQNIVGYQTVPLVQNGFTATGATLAPIGMVGSNMKLGDIVANENFAPFEDAIQIFNAAGEVEVFATYVSQALIDENDLTVDAGWYDMADQNMEGSTLNDFVMPFGTSMTAFTSYADVGLMYVGEVVQSDVDLPLTQNGFTAIANASPVDLTLGDIVANENFAPFEDAIQIFNSEGEVTVFATYVSQALIDENELTVDAGWYDMADQNMEGSTLNDTLMPAGQGITAFTSYIGVAVTIPNPMTN